MQNTFISCQEEYQQKLHNASDRGRADVEVARCRWSSHPAPAAGDAPAQQAPSSQEPAWMGCALMAPVLSTAQGSLAGFPGDTPCYGACLCCHTRNVVNSCSACDPDFPEKLLSCFFFPILSLSRRLILPQSRSLSTSLLNWTLFFS